MSPRRDPTWSDPPQISALRLALIFALVLAAILVQAFSPILVLLSALALAFAAGG
ncbi:hypothetical protein [Breoghania sp. L-A4]|uniref:hypothetical protein n=1 Tax=Breoghania sp. L-A4 TaxID=2304600 RepID=UPI0013C33F67|nr:hypothetical protein [Breoghania sp. L-A4]